MSDEEIFEYCRDCQHIRVDEDGSWECRKCDEPRYNDDQECIECENKKEIREDFDPWESIREDEAVERWKQERYGNHD